MRAARIATRGAWRTLGHIEWGRGGESVAKLISGSK